MELRSRACVSYLPRQATSGHRLRTYILTPTQPVRPRGYDTWQSHAIATLGPAERSCFYAHAARRGSRAKHDLHRVADALGCSRPRWCFRMVVVGALVARCSATVIADIAARDSGRCHRVASGLVHSALGLWPGAVTATPLMRAWLVLECPVACA